MKKITFIIALIFYISLAPLVLAEGFDKDLSISPESVKVSGDILVGETVRIYTTVTNHSNQDLFGVVKFYDEKKQVFIGSDQPISVLASKTDDVFADWIGDAVGNHEISVRVIPWITEGDNTSNNKVTKTIYVDTDSDGDGTGDRADNDDDNDGVLDNNDAFPYNPDEWEDTDGDGIGNNEDTDDDGDGVSDTEDIFPLDPNEWIDTDGDGVGDNADKFPNDPNEWADSDNDSLGDNSDPDNQNHGPLPEIETESQKVRKGDVVTFNALKSRDPDGEIVHYEWDLGNGNIKTGVVVDHIFEKTGAHEVKLKVTDDKGESREKTISINVAYKWQLIAFIFILILLALLIIANKLLLPEIGKKSSAKTSAVNTKKALPKKKK